MERLQVALIGWAFRPGSEAASMPAMTMSRRTILTAALAAPLTVQAEAVRRLVVPLAAEPTGLIPGLNDQPECRIVGTKLYQGLVRFSLDATPLPDLAASWTAAPDGRSVAFRLRPGIVWHDGVPFTADDAAFSIDRFHRLLSPRVGALLARIASVQANDPGTVTVTLSAPFPELLTVLDALSTPIVPRHIHDRPGFGLAFGQDPRAVRPVGTGPFHLTSWLRLERFGQYAGPPPPLDEIVFPVLPDPAARLAAAQTGQPVLLAADAVPLASLPRLRQQGLQVGGQTLPNHAAMAWLDINHAVPPLDDERVRLAVAYAVDRTALLRDVWSGLGRLALSPVPGVADPGVTLPPFDPRAAAGQLDAAGLRPNDTGIRLHASHLVRSEAPWPQLAGMLRDMLAQIGVELALETVDPADWARRISAGDYQTTGMIAEAGGSTPLDAAARKRLVDAVDQVWLVEPFIPIAADRRLRAPGGVYSAFADAELTA